jgi:hypothetical protein
VKELTFDYFDQLVVQYREQHGPIKGLYSDPRGLLVEPHTGREVPIGTLQVASYEAPSWVYDKILYVEKKGLRPIFAAAQLGERYDMAILYGEGYGSEAARELFQRADRSRQYQLFVLHDADPHGYNIARTMREATRRMPEYAVDVVDFGLKIADAVALGLETEEFTRRKALPAEVEAALTEIERTYFTGRPSRYGRKGKVSEYICRRVELNALTAPQLIHHVESQLAAAGADSKLIPPTDVLRSHGADEHRRAIDGRVQEALSTLISIDTIAWDLAAELRDDILDGAENWPTEAFERYRASDWRQIVKGRVTDRIAKVEDLDSRIRERVLQAIKEVQS